jgi:alpha-1,3-mannosyltransferase
VDAFLEGERDYTKIEGDTGPLVYPAGFLYFYSAIKFLTGGQVFPAQVTEPLNLFNNTNSFTLRVPPWFLSIDGLCLRAMNSWGTCVQILFGVLYIVNLGLVLLLYIKSEVVCMQN